MESITMRFYANLFRSSTPVSNPVIPTGKIPRILPAEVRAAIKTMKAATVPGPDHISADLLRAEGIAYTRYLRKMKRLTFKRKESPTSGEPPEQSSFTEGR
ncbi:unnamed protein product [Strongylus vulgaris]|uniref:Uncharacterized protein n=1 Tax=Strongylus vulgaris TaxID=40348 RepID=A0A3P7IW48_STRVU|nr:unnamed protein product [Strongylus vulgaris]